MFIFIISKKLLNNITLTYDPHSTDLLKVQLEAPSSTIQLLIGERKGPLSRQLGKLKVRKLPLEIAVEG